MTAQTDGQAPAVVRAIRASVDELLPVAGIAYLAAYVAVPDIRDPAILGIVGTILTGGALRRVVSK